jgi:hypothetical protein
MRAALLWLGMRDERALVVFDGSASARRALAAAVALEAPLTVVAVAPRDVRAARCGFQGPGLEQAVRARPRPRAGRAAR